MIEIFEEDCLNFMKKKLKDNSIKCVITSPPYNRKISYNTYNDNKKWEDYCSWMDEISIEIKRILSEDGHFFFNLGSSCKSPWYSTDISQIIRKHFVLQNKIIWAHSVSINDTGHGHFRPINSNIYLNNLYEDLYHFTKSGNIKIDRQSIGVPYVDSSNTKRWKSKKNKRCLGNVWYIPYETINFKSEKGNHPAIFPEKLVENCLKISSISEDDIVYDPFAGTGTTLVACYKNNINCIGTEIDSEYVEYAKSRIKKNNIKLNKIF